MRSQHLIWISTSAVIAATLLGTLTQAWLSANQTHDVASVITGGNPARAPELIRRYGCAGCHAIGGIAGGDGQVGGPLSDMRKRVYIGGVVTNSPENLVRWIVNPRQYSPRTAMPASGISEGEARDVAAFLYTR